MGCCSDAGHGADGQVSGLTNRDSDSRRSLVNSTAVMQHGNGVDPVELGAFIESVAALAANRVRGVGAQEYGGEIQQFETKTIDQLRNDILEEVADVMAYAGMIALKTFAMREQP